MKRKTKAPQFELPHAEEAFNLRSETALDGNRLQEEKRLIRLSQEDAARRQPLLTLDLPPAGCAAGRKLDRMLTGACKQAAIKDALKLKEQAARKALGTDLAQFLGPAQRMVLLQHLFKGEEKEWFFDKMLELAERVRAMPKTYEQEGKGDQAIVSLHYFGSSYDGWITERDQEQEQLQAFGLVKFHSGDPELGYLSVEEWLATGAELDFHFTPCTLAELKEQRHL